MSMSNKSAADSAEYIFTTGQLIHDPILKVHIDSDFSAAIAGSI